MRCQVLVPAGESPPPVGTRVLLPLEPFAEEAARGFVTEQQERKTAATAHWVEVGPDGTIERYMRRENGVAENVLLNIVNNTVAGEGGVEHVAGDVFYAIGASQIWGVFVRVSQSPQTISRYESPAFLFESVYKDERRVTTGEGLLHRAMMLDGRAKAARAAMVDAASTLRVGQSMERGGVKVAALSANDASAKSVAIPTPKALFESRGNKTYAEVLEGLLQYAAEHGQLERKQVQKLVRAAFPAEPKPEPTEQEKRAALERKVEREFARVVPYVAGDVDRDELLEQVRANVRENVKLDADDAADLVDRLARRSDEVRKAIVSDGFEATIASLRERAQKEDEDRRDELLWMITHAEEIRSKCPAPDGDCGPADLEAFRAAVRDELGASLEEDPEG